MIRKWINSAIRDELGKHPVPGGYSPLAQMANESNPYVTVSRISNGYIMVINDTRLLGSASVMIYCKDEKEVADQLTTHTAKVRLSIPNPSTFADAWVTASAGGSGTSAQSAANTKRINYP